MSLESILRSAKRAAGAALVAVAGLAYAGDAQLVTVIGKGGGLNGSQWRSEIVLTNPSLTETAHGRLVFYDTNPGSDDTNPSIPYTVSPRASLPFADPLGQAGLSGNWAVKAIPDQESVSVSAVARTWNEQDLDTSNPAKTDLSQYANSVSMTQLLQPGDLAIFTLPDSTPQADGRPAFRFNTHQYGESTTVGENPAFRVDLFSASGEYVNTRTETLPDHGRSQFVDFVPTVFERAQLPYDVLRITVTKGLVSIIGTPVQNNGDKVGLDDGGVQLPAIERLVTEFSYHAAPGTMEANDTGVYHLHIHSRDGTKIDGCSLYGGLEGNVAGNGTNDLTWDQTFVPTVAGTYQLSATCGVSTTDGGFLGARTTPQTPLVVNAEQNGYVANATDAKNYIMNNLARVSKWTSQGLVGGNATTPTQWQGWWTQWFDGVSDPAHDNYEVDHLTFNDIGNSMTGNNILVTFKDGTATGISGLPEYEFDQFRNGVKAALPK